VKKSVKDHCLDRIDQIADNRHVAATANKRHHAARIETIQRRVAVPAYKKP